MKEIMEMYVKFEAELEHRIATSRREISYSRTGIETAEKNLVRDMEALAEIRRLMEEYR